MQILLCAESVRKYPTLPILNRICTSDYAVPGTALTIRAGTPVVVSLMGIGRDERYFPEPLRFQPERFAPDSQRHDADAFLAFGEGPRMCIGMCDAVQCWTLFRKGERGGPAGVYEFNVTCAHIQVCVLGK